MIIATTPIVSIRRGRCLRLATAGLAVIALLALSACSPRITPRRVQARARLAAQTATGEVRCDWRKPTTPAIPTGTPSATAPNRGRAVMTITTNLGVISIVMDRSITPCTIADLAYLASAGFYVNTRCHRLTNDELYVLQCGDPTGDGSGQPSYWTPDENVPDTLPADRVTPDPVTYHRATVSMANAGPNTNGSQFFFTYKDCQIPDAFTPFGQVTAGMSIIDRVAKGGVFDEYGINSYDGEPRIKLSFKSVTVTSD